MLVLAFDTATPAVTVAVGSAERVIAQETTIDARRQGELLAVSIQKVLADAGVAAGDLDAIVAGAGPARTPGSGLAWSPPASWAAHSASPCTVCARST